MFKRILSVICEHYGVGIMDVTYKTRKKDEQRIVEVRQMAAYMLWSWTDLTINQVADILDYKDKANVTQARNAIATIAQGNPVMRETIKVIEDKIKRK